MKSSNQAPSPYATVDEVANHFAVHRRTVLKWIETGVFEAIDVSRDPAGKSTKSITRRRWRIPRGAIATFETKRNTQFIHNVPSEDAETEKKNRLRNVRQFV